MQSKARGRALATAATTLQLVGGLIAVWFFLAWRWSASHSSLLERELDLLGTGAGSLFFIWGQTLGRRARQHLNEIIPTAESIGDDPFVLYLRPFEDDSSRDRFDPTPRGAPGFPSDLLTSGLTGEEQLVAALKPVGRVIALGVPGQKLPQAGARRMYLAHDAWQDTVLALMERARLVVLVLGAGRSLMWELVQSVRMLPPERLVLIVPMERAAYDAFAETAVREFRETAEQMLRESGRSWTPPTLPAYPPHETGAVSEEGAFKVVVHFEADWTPRPILLKRPLVSGDQLKRSLKRGLRPALERWQD
ncbi:hypothetical protein [Kitasatospora sp. NPDC047058]|uniref:hypothetical protein n=1 Tax=Kitasatospora sp. NPDC047058 TaxID=3155620 RepID=UPI003406BFFD